MSAANGVSARNDWTTMWCSQATGAPASSSDAVDRLHGCVRQVRQIINGVQRLGGFFQCGCRVALLACAYAGLLRQLRILFALFAAIEIGQLAIVPDYLERLAPLLGRPEAL